MPQSKPSSGVPCFYILHRLNWATLFENGRVFMKIRPVRMLLSIMVLGIAAGGHARAAVPPAPAPLTPAAGASVLVPFTISWAAVSDPSGIVAYNWQVSAS